MRPWGIQGLPPCLLADLLHPQLSSDVAWWDPTHKAHRWVVVETLNGRAETRGGLLSPHPAPF